VSEIEFIPKRLNQAPVVFWGMTMREVGMIALCGFLFGLVLGVLIAILSSEIAIAPTVAFLCAGASLYWGGRLLEKMKRNRPESWFYRAIQFRFRRAGFAIFGGADLIKDDEIFEIKRIRSPARKR